MELLQLRYFTAVAEDGNFTHAARRLHVSQPALSYQIKRLENEVGARLFHRQTRRVSLTSDGKAFLPLAQDVLRKADEALRVMDERLGVERGEVSLGTIPSVGVQIIPHILSTFRRNFPGIEVRVAEAGSVDLAAKVTAGELDLAIVSSAPPNHQSLEITPLITEELLLVLPAGHELAEHSSVDLRRLADYEWVLPGQAFTLSDLLISECRRAGFEPRVAFRTGTLESVRSFVRHELGISVLPRLALYDQKDDLVVGLPFQKPLTRDLSIIRAKERYAAVAARAMSVHIRTTVLSSFASLGRPLAG
ncbi:MAG: LysR substrate-binding domain-containing protein [Thermoleophilia bacterium]